jgi:hypothetical protein
MEIQIEHIIQKNSNQRPKYQEYHGERYPKPKHKRNKKHKNNAEKEQEKKFLLSE